MISGINYEDFKDILGDIKFTRKEKHDEIIMDIKGNKLLLIFDEINKFYYLKFNQKNNGNINIINLNSILLKNRHKIKDINDCLKLLSNLENKYVNDRIKYI